MNAQYQLCQLRQRYETTLREYECAHAVWMDTPKFSPAGESAQATLDFARKAYCTAEQAWRVADQEARHSRSVLTIVSDALSGKNYGPADACDAVRALEQRAKLMEAVVDAARWCNELNKNGHALAGSSEALSMALKELDAK